jgi:hypothetical protein
VQLLEGLIVCCLHGLEGGLIIPPSTREKHTVPTKLLGTPPYFQCILMALRVLVKMKIIPERLGLDFFFYFSE